MKGIMKVAAMCCGVVLSGAAWAQEAAFEVPRLSSPYVKDFEAFKLAANDTGAWKQPDNSLPAVKNTEYVPPVFTGSNVHKYLGLATIVGAALTALTAPEGCESNCSAQTPRETNGTHAHLAEATVAMAVATVITGMLAHSEDVHFADGLKDPDNLHAMLGVTGAALMAYAVNKSKHSAVPVNHAAIAELGALCMVAAIKITW